MYLWGASPRAVTIWQSTDALMSAAKRQGDVDTPSQVDSGIRRGDARPTARQGIRHERCGVR
jgi:hypothetical protein